MTLGLSCGVVLGATERGVDAVVQPAIKRDEGELALNVNMEYGR